MKPPKTENPNHLKAYEYFYSLGEKRSLTRVAKRYKKTLGAVSVWAKTFDWWDKVEKRDKKVSDSILSDLDAYKRKSKEETLKLIRATKARYAQLLKNQKISATDFERVCRLEQLLLGEATDRFEDNSIAALVKRARLH